jgi:hypothetical protein
MQETTQGLEAGRRADSRKLEMAAGAAARRFESQRRAMRGHGIQYDEAGRPIIRHDPGLVGRARRLFFGS